MPLFRRVQPPFGLKTLQKDSNCVLIQDPSAIWGGADHLPRRNLLTYSEDFSNAAWTKARLTVLAGQEDSGGGQAAFALIEDSSNDTHTLAQTVNGLTSTDTHTAKVIAKAAGRTWIAIYNTGASGDGRYAFFDLQNCVLGTVGNNASASISSLGGGWCECAIRSTYVNAGGQSVTVRLANSSSSSSFQGNGTASVYVHKMMLATGRIQDLSFQKVTDWTTEQYAWAATKNVPWLRRNASNATESIANATYWTTTACSAAGSTVTAAAGNTSHYIVAATGSTATFSVGQSMVLSAKLKYINQQYVQLFFFSASHGVSAFANFNIQAGSVGSVGVAITGSGISAADELGYRTAYIIAPVTIAAAGGFACAFVPASSSARAEAQNAAGTEQFGITEIMYATTGATYQKLATTWPAEYTALALAAGYPISLYSDRAGTTATVGPDDPVGKLLDLSGDNNHATAPSDAARPNLRLDGNGKFYLDRDTTDDALAVTWPANFTTTAAQYVADQATTTETTGITLNGAASYTTPQRPTGDYGRIIFKAPTPNVEKVKKYLDKKAGR